MDQAVVGADEDVDSGVPQRAGVGQALVAERILGGNGDDGGGEPRVAHGVQRGGPYVGGDGGITAEQDRREVTEVLQAGSRR